MTKKERAMLWVAVKKLGALDDDYDGAMRILYKLLGHDLPAIDPGKFVPIHELMAAKPKKFGGQLPEGEE